MYVNWQDEVFDDTILIPVYESFFSFIAGKTEKSRRKWKRFVGSATNALVPSLHPSADLSVLNPLPDNYCDKYHKS